MDTYLEVLRASGRRLTRQRRLVFEIIQKNAGHLEAETIYQLAKKRDTRISLATIYRSLALLKEAGLVQEHSLGQGHGHYETVQPDPHYHFTCLKCERVIEFDAPQVAELAEALSQREGLQITEVHLLLNGYCAQCRVAAD
jgi:Fe2+ or Zn2+ uptake regulation protein